ncbi:unnamed protein product [Lactuca virosa]|uniref:Uncharacterized protein n=1 Tax=Lactuca virosa TaxID=75947 RepID=A0AAU9PJD1_9ASTR|nr:unnamed protein product [Lactuca virosa]
MLRLSLLFANSKLLHLTSENRLFSFSIWVNFVVLFHENLEYLGFTDFSALDAMKIYQRITSMGYTSSNSLA